MDFTRPVESLIPGAQGRLLATLARVEAEVPITRVAELAGVGRTQASTVLGELASLGVLKRREIGRTVLVSLDRTNAAGRLIDELSRLRSEVLAEIGVLARGLQPIPESVAVFGSFARGEAEVDSDLDLLVVRPSDVDDDKWADAMTEFATRVTSLTGNHTQLHEVSTVDLRRRARPGRAKLGQSFWSSVARDAITLAGSDVRYLIGGSGDPKR